MTPDDALTELRTPPSASRRRPRFGAASPTAPVELPSGDASVPFELTWRSDDLALEVVVRRAGEELVAAVRLAGGPGCGEAVGVALFGFDTKTSVLKSVAVAEEDQERTGEASLGNLLDIRQELGARVTLIGFLQELVTPVSPRKAPPPALVAKYGKLVQSELDRMPSFTHKVVSGDKDAVVKEMDRVAPGLLRKAGLGEQYKRTFLLLVEEGLDDAKTAGLRAAVPVWLAKLGVALHGDG